jgi:hypothetical protein
MNEKNKKILWSIAAFPIAVILVCAYLWLCSVFNIRKPIDAGELDRQRLELDREYAEREQRIAGNLAELGSIAEDAIAAVERAGEITQRTDRELYAAATNLREAKSVFGVLAIQIQNLESELDSCRASLFRIRRLAGLDAGEVEPTPSKQ